ncbi:hypothetical protein [Mesorhizobium caraganae]|nr:hypothetical protein [Mesorhizobium caraganae]
MTGLPFIMRCLMRDGVKMVERGYHNCCAPAPLPEGLLAVRNSGPQLRT